MEKLVSKSLTGFLKFTYKGKPRLARARLDLTPQGGHWACNLEALYAHKRYTARFKVPLESGGDAEAQAQAVSLGILRSIRAWGRPWSDLQGKEIVVELNAS